ncbi:MAG: filamentous hemagglutinin N-terminal domain-containing protein [Rivularia sp. (in: cyanobacteria)]
MKLALNILTLSIFTAILIAPKTQAQITANPGDTNTVVNQSGDTFTITGGTQVDKNVFHSLQKFGLSENQIADFVTNPGTQNILGRITGGDASVINGLIKVTGSDANLYLMNPAGIIFGSGASLNIPGSFTATTANGIGFGDKWFNAVGENNYADLIGEPDSFVFSMSQPGAIANFGDLALNSGETLTLLGGTVINTGTLSSQGGNINIVAIPGKKLVRVTQKGSLLSLGLPTSTENTLNPVNLNPVSLPQLLTGGNLNNATGVTVENGIIKLTGSGVEIPNDSGTAIVSQKVDVSGKIGGKVNILGEKVGVVSGNINASGENGGGTVLIGGDYKGKGTVPNAERTFISRDSVIKADAEDTGNGGKVIAWADNTTAFYGNISARGGKTSGDGGFVEVSGKENLAFDGFVDVGADFGKGGELLLDPKTVEIVFGGTDDSQLNDQEILKDDKPEADDTFRISASKIQDALDNGDVTIEATNNIDVKSDINVFGANAFDLTLDAPLINIDSNTINIRGNLDLQATKDLKIEDSQLRADGNINLQSQNKIEITESPGDSAILTTIQAKGNITIQGDEGILIQALKSKEDETLQFPKAILQSGGDFSLISNKEIIANTRISAGGNFSAGSGSFSQPALSLNGIISSNGDVSFGDYTGSSLKVEAKGNIQGGNITIDKVGTFPQNGDPDISILNSGSALILRAGVTELANSPQSTNVGTTSFISTANPSSEGEIQVGNINAGSSVILSAKGDIVTGSINTIAPLSSRPIITDSVNLVSSAGNIVVDYIQVKDQNLDSSRIGDIKIDSFGVFRATDSFIIDAASFGNGFTQDLKASIVAPGKISIKHGGESFQPALGLEKDSNGKVVFRLVLPGNPRDGEQVIATGSGGTAANLVFLDGSPVNRDSLDIPFSTIISTTVREIPFNLDNLSENTSYTVGGIFVKAGLDAGLYGSFQDTELSNSSNINVVTVPKPEETTPNGEVVQRQLNKDEKNEVCSPQSQTVAINNTENTRGGTTVNNSQSSNNNPCKKSNDSNNILKVIPDNRFDSNSALPTLLFKLGQQ